MTLQDKLDAMRAGAKDRIPPESLAVMHRATEDLKQSGIRDQVLKIGDVAPGFELENTVGERVASSTLLERGPLAVTFYRGVW